MQGYVEDISDIQTIDQSHMELDAQRKPTSGQQSAPISITSSPSTRHSPIKSIRVTKSWNVDLDRTPSDEAYEDL